MESLLSQWLLATLAYPQCKQPQSRIQPDTHNLHAKVALGRRQDPGPRFSRGLCSFLSEPQPPTLPIMAPTYKATRGTSPWLLPLREAKHIAELQGNSGQMLLPLARRNLCIPDLYHEPPCNNCCAREPQGQARGVRTKLLFFLGGTSIKILQPARVAAGEAGLPLPLRAVLAAVNLTRVVLK